MVYIGVCFLKLINKTKTVYHFIQRSSDVCLPSKLISVCFSAFISLPNGNVDANLKNFRNTWYFYML